MKKISIALFVLLSSTMISAHADVDSAHKLANKYLGIAKAINPEYKDFSVEDGKAFFNEKFTVKGKQIACASCHTANPADPGKHIVTGKPIRPLSPVINAKRFADLDKVEKNFTNHFNDIISRDCTAQEKANFIAYLLTADKP
jgi:mono/diheme cytochrome c family protein